MSHIKLNITDAQGFISKNIYSLQDEVNKIHEMIHHKTGLGNDFLGWLELPLNYDKEEYAEMVKA